MLCAAWLSCQHQQAWTLSHVSCHVMSCQMMVKVSPIFKPLLTHVTYNREQWKRMGMQLTGKFAVLSAGAIDNNSRLWTSSLYFSCIILFLAVTVASLSHVRRHLRLALTLHCVQEKSNPCIHCHNSDKQCQILTEFWTNSAISNCKQITKFK